MQSSNATAGCGQSAGHRGRDGGVACMCRSWAMGLMAMAWQECHGARVAYTWHHVRFGVGCLVPSVAAWCLLQQCCCDSAPSALSCSMTHANVSCKRIMCTGSALFGISEWLPIVQIRPGHLSSASHCAVVLLAMTGWYCMRLLVLYHLGRMPRLPRSLGQLHKP